MKILKASAGSGKTFRLSETYRRLLLDSREPCPHRHILAVTFTNKATAEMKNRILDDLSGQAAADPHAKEVLTSLLHDYGAFAISTIDRFFQGTLKAFSREIGQVADYQVELDRPSVINEAMDRILDSLSENDRQLVQWIKDGVFEKMQEGGKLNFDSALHEMGAMLKSEDHRVAAEQFGIDDLKAYSKDRLKILERSCKAIIKDFEKKVSAEGISVKPGEKISVPSKKILSSSVEITDLFGAPYRHYCTARIIRNLIFSLGVAGEFYKEFDALLKEKNIMCLDESNTILKKIIDGSDAPFIYEKTGVRFENFLLDEFQDTSTVQWDNFKPLIAESESNARESLVVGDIKQSIYRWRNSDWKLLGEQILKDFPKAGVEVMDSNWRSAREVVDFNNGFFTFTSGRLGLEDIYSDVCQRVKSDDPQGGQVRVSFTDEQMETILQSIKDVMSRGARWNDIAVLVRGNETGSLIAQYLIDNSIPVISDDSLKVSSSAAVRRVVSLLSGFENPDDKLSSYLAGNLGIEYPSDFHSLTDICEYFIRQISLEDSGMINSQSAFVQTFMDDVRDWSSLNGNDVHGFLEHWKDSDLSIASPENECSVRIMTIHKSKGLEFPHVIFPFANKVGLFKAGSVHWCHFDPSGTPFPAEAEGIYPVEMSGTVCTTHFEKDYIKERSQQVIDNINVFYVALTRAAKSLHVIAARTPKTCVAGCRKPGYEWKDFSQLLYFHCGCLDEYVCGEPYDFRAMKRKPEAGDEMVEADYPSFELAGRLKPSTDASDFFGEDGVTGVQASPRVAGILLHDILSRVEGPSDLKASVNAALRDGILSEEDAQKASDLLSGRIAEHPDWFPENGAVKVYNEMSILDADGGEQRPDRVIANPDGSVTIVDYKFGERRQNHVDQVRGYVDLYRKMGYGQVRGFVWYVREGDVIPA